MTQDLIKIDSKPFGEIEIQRSQLLHFPSGILAFEEYREYALLPSKEGSGFFWLQSLDDPRLAFVLINPHSLLGDYVPVIAEAELEELGLQKAEAAEVWVIVTVPPNQPEKMTVNLQGPILVNRERQLAGQYISSLETHRVRVSLVELLENGGKL